MKPARTLLVVPFLILVAACGAADSDSTAEADMAPGDSLVSPEAPGAPDVGQADSAGGRALYDGEAGAASAGSKSAPLEGRSVISRGQVSLESDDIDRARFELQKLLDGLGGAVTNEESSADDGRTENQMLEVRVPSAKFGAAMDGISGLGKLVDRSRTTEDVSTQVIDNNARVRSQRLSLARVQALLAQAKDLNQIIAIETQLSQRQAELDSLEQQQKYLADQTAQATINVYLSTPDEATGADQDDDGFVAGLSAGWDALLDTTGALLKGTGAVLPFALLAALIGAPAWLLVRRRRTLA